MDVDLPCAFTDVTTDGTLAEVTHVAIMLYGPEPAEFTA